MSEEQLEQLGARLKKLRKEARLTQETVARKLHTSRGSISMYENGRRQPPYDLLIGMADLYQVNLDFLLGKSSIASLFPHLSREEMALLEAYRHTDAATRQVICTILRRSPRQSKRPAGKSSSAPAKK